MIPGVSRKSSQTETVEMAQKETTTTTLPQTQTHLLIKNELQLWIES